MAKSPRDLIFEALCLRYRSTPNVSKTMTRQELQEATGLPLERPRDALKVLCGPEYDHDLRVRFGGGDSEKITLGRSWLSRCDNTGRKA
jgi:hypothetical protein